MILFVVHQPLSFLIETKEKPNNIFQTENDRAVRAASHTHTFGLSEGD
jgi:hypothetical protein